MINPYTNVTMQQHNVAKFDEMCSHQDEFYTIGGSTLARLVPIMEALFMEQRISGDKMRDAAQVIEAILKHATE